QLAIRSMGGESEAAWRTVLDDLVARSLKKPELAIVDGAPGLEKALTSLWADIPIQRCTVHKLRNLIAHAPKKLAEEVAADFSDMIYAKTAKEVAARRKAFIRKWPLKCRAVADSLEEAGDNLFTFTRLPVAQWKSVLTTNAIERLHEEFKAPDMTTKRVHHRPQPLGSCLRGSRNISWSANSCHEDCSDPHRRLRTIHDSGSPPVHGH